MDWAEIKKGRRDSSIAFNFFGTFTSSQWAEFKAFVSIQKIDLYQRKAWIQKELTRCGVFVTDYDGPNPVGFAAVANSYADKLLQAYRILGGVPERDMLLRTSDIPVFLPAGSPPDVDAGSVSGGGSDMMTNGRRLRGDQRFDRDLGLKVEKLKSWQTEVIKLKRERIEYKIKRALDYSDQLQKESAMIDALMAGGLGSPDDQINEVEIQIATPDAANVVDNDTDIFGLDIGVPSDLTRDEALVDQEEGAER